jgi:hypothetical protein
MTESASIVNQVINSVTNVSNKHNAKPNTNNAPHQLLKIVAVEDYKKKKLHTEKTIMEDVINDFKK